MMDACIETFTGVMFNLLHPTIEMIAIEDIAHSGSQLCRFTGHTRHHYSIAQHELHGSYLVPEENALEFLLHDAAESFVNDMSRPLKHMTAMGDLYRPIEENIQVLVRKKYGLPVIQSPIIHKIDNMMLLAEKKQLMGKADWLKMGIENWEVNTNESANIVIQEMAPKEVELKFLKRFKQLTGE
jgi:5'-deoxynucleotidase YfbR-like HD superfamily hydrolase